MNGALLFLFALAGALAFASLGEVLRTATPGLRRVMLPGSVIGGGMALALGPQVLSADIVLPWVPDLYAALGEFPSVFINVVFACLMLGKPIDPFTVIWSRAKPQIVMGHVYAWGQYVIGFSLTLLILQPLFSVDALAGPAIAIGFQGGHGTAAGLSSNFRELGFEDGKSIAYALATFGIVVGALFGPLLATWMKTHWADEADQAKPASGGKGESDETEEERKATSVSFSPLTGKLTLHLSLIGLVIATGWLTLKGLQSVESVLRSSDSTTLFTDYIPLFSIVLIVGLAAQVLLQRTGLQDLFDRSIFNLISALSLDVVIVTALASLSLETVGSYWLPILLLCAGGLAWNLCVFFLLGPRVYPKPWFVYGLGDLGGGTATTASGLLLIRAADPEERTQARLAYSEKQPFYEPLMGGGLVTAFALPMVASFGLVPCLIITGGTLTFFLTIAIRTGINDQSKAGPSK